VLRAFGDGRFAAARFAAYERRFHRGARPFLRFIASYYDPAFLEVFLRPTERFALLDSVTGVLAGGSVLAMPLRMRLSLALFFAIVRVNRLRRRLRGGRESRLEW